MDIVKMPEGKKLGWDFTDFIGAATVVGKDGKPVSGEIISIDDVQYAELRAKFGTLYIGFNGKYGQWAFEENGGAVMVPYAISPIRRRLYVAGGYEIRLLVNNGEKMFTPPGGFSLNQENPEDTAKRETLEETGVHINNLINVGEGTPNRAFWIKQPDGNWPQTFFACKVNWFALRKKRGCHRYLPSTENAIAELDKLSKLEFMPVLDAIAFTQDEIAISAFAKTLVAFHEGRL